MRILFVDVEPALEARMLQAAVDQGMQVGEPPDLVVVGADVDAPLQVAQHWARTSGAPAVLLARADKLDALRQAVLVSPFLSVQTECWSIEDNVEAKLKRIGQNIQRSSQGRAMAAFAEASLGVRKPRASSMLGSLLEQAPIGVAVVTEQQNVLAWNQAAARITGTPEREALGGSLARALQTTPWDGEPEEINTLHKQPKCLALTWAPPSSEEGRLVVFQDVTNERQMEASLRDSLETLEQRVKERTTELRQANEQLLSEIEERHAAQRQLERQTRHLQDAQRIARIGSWRLTNSGIEGSAELWNIMGVDQLGGVDELLDITHPDDRAAVGAQFERLEQGKPIEFDHRILVDGAERLLHVRGGTFDGETTGTVEDITQRARAQQEAMEATEQLRQLEQIREMNEFRSNFMNATAHELSTPLTPMAMQIHMLKTVFADEVGERGQRSVAILERNFVRLRRLVEDVLETVRLEGGAVQIEPVEGDLADVAKGVIDTYASAAAAAGVTLHLDAESTIGSFDADRMSQVIDNLISNGIKYAPGGNVTLRVRGGESMLVEVIDDGLGMTPNGLENLFLPFSRLHTEEHDIPGTGLGLHICRNIVGLHGGSISGHSDGPGKGSTFRLELPLTVMA